MSLLKNYGRRPGVTSEHISQVKPEVLQEPTPLPVEQKPIDVETKPSFVKEEVPKKPFFSFKKDKDKEEKKGNISLESDMVFKELYFFVPELVIIMMASFAAIAVYMIIEVGIVDIEGLGILPVLIPIIAMAGLFGFKFMIYQPGGSKQFVMRIWRNGQIRFSVEKITSGEIAFDTAPDTDKIKVTNPRRHWDNMTGKPVVVIRQGDGENISLNDNQNVSEEGKDLSNVVSSIYGTAARITEYNLMKGDSFFANPTNILLIVILGVVGVTAFLVLQQPDQIASLFGR